MSNTVEQNLKNFFSDYPGVVSVFIFGSEARGGRTPRSDIDVAILFSSNQIPDFRSQLNLKEDLVSLLQTEVDLVVLNQAKPILKHQVLKNGKQIILKHDSTYQEFFARSLVEYADLKKVRDPIERAILKGRSYGG